MAELEQGRYKYVCHEGSSLMSTHRVMVNSRKVRSKAYSRLLLALLLLIAVAGGLQWIPLLLPLALALLLGRGPVAEEAVVVMPSLGVQLETVYGSGKVLRRFVPVHRIMAAVINEAVTPTHCYFYLALILRGDPKLTLAFQEIRPPLDMLVPVWRCLSETIEPNSWPEDSVSTKEQVP